MRFEDQVVVITGAAGDIGRALADGFSAEGARTACLDLDFHGARTLAAELQDRGRTAEAFSVDLTDWNVTSAVAGEVARRFGRVDAVLANAGGSLGQSTPFLDLTPHEWRATVDRNLTSAFHTGLAFGRLMALAGAGRFVFTTSELAHVTSAGFAAYSAAKGAVRQLMGSMAAELAPHGIRVNAVAPGPTMTRGTREQFERPQVTAAFARDIPLGRVARPAELVGAAMYLASSEASFTTGATLLVDGGLTLK